MNAGARPPARRVRALDAGPATLSVISACRSPNVRANIRILTSAAHRLPAASRRTLSAELAQEAGSGASARANRAFARRTKSPRGGPLPSASDRGRPRSRRLLTFIRSRYRQHEAARSARRRRGRGCRRRRCGRCCVATTFTRPRVARSVWARSFSAKRPAQHGDAADSGARASASLKPTCASSGSVKVTQGRMSGLHLAAEAKEDGADDEARLIARPNG